MPSFRVDDLVVGESRVYTIDWSQDADALDTDVQSVSWQSDGPLTIVSSALEGRKAKVRVSADSGSGEARLICAATMSDNVHVLKTTLLVSVRSA